MKFKPIAVSAALIFFASANAFAETPSIIDVTGSFYPGPYTSIAADPRRPQVVVVGAADGFLLVSENGGRTSRESRVLSPRQYIGDQNRPDGAQENGNIYSRRFLRFYNADIPTGHWENFMAGDFNPPTALNVVTAPGPDARVVVASDSGVYVSGTGESDFTQTIGSPRTIGHRYVAGHSLARDPANGAHVLAGTSVGLFSSQNGGVTFERSADENVESADIKQIVWDDRHSNTVLVATLKDLFRSDDRGKTFTHIYKSDDELGTMALGHLGARHDEHGLWLAGDGISWLPMTGENGAPNEDAEKDFLKEESIIDVLPFFDQGVLCISEQGLFAVGVDGSVKQLLRTGYNDVFVALAGGPGMAWTLSTRGIYRIGPPMARIVHPDANADAPHMIATLIEVERAVSERFHIKHPEDTRFDRPGDRRVEERDRQYSRLQLAGRWFARFIPKVQVQVSNGYSRTSSILRDFTLPLAYRQATATASSFLGGGLPGDESGFTVMATWNLSEAVFGPYSNVSDPLQFGDQELAAMRKQVLEELRHQYRQCAHLVQLLQHPPVDEAVALQWHMRMEEHAAYLEAMVGRAVVVY